jgi:hypothetical protein
VVVRVKTYTRFEIVSEEDLAQHVKRVAKRHGWKGVHTRYSQGVIESVHTIRQDGFSEALGLPDWFFWHEDLGQSFFVELKSTHGRLGRYQKPMIPSLRKAGLTVFEWRPQDAQLIEITFHYGLSQ